MTPFHQSQNDYLREWKECSIDYLFHLLDIEAPPGNQSCMSCMQRDGSYRCQDCFNQNWYCKDCCLADHQRHPFHRIQVWNGDFFKKVSLRDLGFILHLGHQGQPCPSLHPNASFPPLHSEHSSSSENLPPKHSKMTIVDRFGIYEHNVEWCACPGNHKRDLHLFRMRLFPASINDPKTAFTFQGLNYFHIDSMECRTSAGNYFKKLKRLTNENFPDMVKVSILFLSLNN
jgi:CxC2 like cysteine cluster associated with KDZ transposases